MDHQIPKVCENCAFFERQIGSCFGGRSSHCGEFVSRNDTCTVWSQGKYLRGKYYRTGKEQIEPIKG